MENGTETLTALSIDVHLQRRGFCFTLPVPYDDFGGLSETIMDLLDSDPSFEAFQGPCINAACGVTFGESDKSDADLAAFVAWCVTTALGTARREQSNG